MSVQNERKDCFQKIAEVIIVPEPDKYKEERDHMKRIVNKEAVIKSLESERKTQLRLKKYEDDSSYPYLLFKCPSAVDGVTEIVKEWAKINDINLFIISSDGNEFPVERGGSIRIEDYMSIEGYKSDIAVVDMISKPNTVLLLENADQFEAKYRHALMSIINNRAIIDDREENGFKKLNNLLFAVITVGPMEHVDFNTLWRLDAKECRLIKVEEA